MKKNTRKTWCERELPFKMKSKLYDELLMKLRVRFFSLSLFFCRKKIHWYYFLLFLRSKWDELEKWTQYKNGKVFLMKYFLAKVLHRLQFMLFTVLQHSLGRVKIPNEQKKTTITNENLDEKEGEHEMHAAFGNEIEWKVGRCGSWCPQGYFFFKKKHPNLLASRK